MSTTGARGRVLMQGARFVGLGLVSYPSGLLITAALHEMLGFSAPAATAIALALLLIANFIASRRYVFRVGGGAVRQLIRFGTASFVMRGVEYVLFLMMLSSLGLNYLVSLAVAMGLSAAAKFVLYRNVVFREGTS